MMASSESLLRLPCAATLPSIGRNIITSPTPTLTPNPDSSQVSLT